MKITEGMRFRFKVELFFRRLFNKELTRKDYLRRWVKKLRSGKYNQGARQLYNPETNCFCVLGVLADIFYPLDRSNLSSCAILPNTISDIVDIPDSPRVDLCGISYPLWLLNDDYNWDFTRLATLIEEKYGLV